ncbi:MAG: cob(I)yrinic acid a,c-diamide adenosyltransferase [Planctomycetes bacterium]|nr:cob(I)yrinic acid a,c-diamide adenosyltransferase [Planctomycetota bacterium]
MENSGRVLLFTGDGKGKTTAALGMALRAAGHGMPTFILQFVKADSSTGEIAAIKHLPTVEIVQAGRGFAPPPTSPMFQEHTRAARNALAQASNALASGKYSMVVLDEICGAVAHGLIEEERVADLVRAKPKGTILVLTGRDATDGLIELADTVTEMRSIKHGLDIGRKAQEGVEF